VTGNDPRLEPLLESGGAELEIERLLVEVAAPLVHRIVARYCRASAHVARDAGDLESTVNLRLLQKLRRVAGSPADAIQDLESYIARLTYNVVNDHLRRRYPERMRLKNRLRYTLTHDARLALWSAPRGMVAGLKPWSGGAVALTSVPLPSGEATRRMRDRRHPAEALHALLEAVGTPVELETLIDYMAELWHVVDLAPVEVEPLEREWQDAPSQLERRELLAALWREIEQLRPMQRKALLLNLRDDETVNVVALLVLTGTARLEEIAAALEMSADELAAIWNDLPLDDLRISLLLGVTRQQVINLRKSARERLRRRLRNKRADRTS
jgi:RNA polymerase sigma factor (sigma-70 family)